MNTSTRLYKFSPKNKHKHFNSSKVCLYAGVCRQNFIFTVKGKGLKIKQSHLEIDLPNCVHEHFHMRPSFIEKSRW